MLIPGIQHKATRHAATARQQPSARCVHKIDHNKMTEIIWFTVYVGLQYARKNIYTQVCGANCVLVNNSNATNAAGPWGSSEGNCATPNILYTSAVQFMQSEVGARWLELLGCVIIKTLKNFSPYQPHRHLHKLMRAL